MSQSSAKKLMVILVFAFLGWTACGATMGLGLAFLNIGTTLLIHALGAPIYFIILSLIYFRKYGYTGPLTTAVVFIGFVILVDFFVVALMVNKSLDMFRSFLGTWLPFILIFCATWMTGRLVFRQKKVAPSH
jgi:hypothetical protein